MQGPAGRRTNEVGAARVPQAFTREGKARPPCSRVRAAQTGRHGFRRARERLCFLRGGPSGVPFAARRDGVAFRTCGNAQLRTRDPRGERLVCRSALAFKGPSVLWMGEDEKPRVAGLSGRVCNAGAREAGVLCKGGELNTTPVGALGIAHI